MANELFALLTEAKTVYLHDVVLGGKQYNRYVDDFVNGHRYIDCDHAACRNSHEMNIYIVKGLLTECASSVQPCFAAPDFTFNECMKLKRMYDTSESLSPLGPPRINRPAALSLSFGCNFTPEQMKSIVACANTYHLFCSPVTIDDMESLFSCKIGFCLRVNSVRRVAILFDALLENSFIQPYWQSVLERGRFLQSKDGSHFISATSISTTLSLVRNKMTSTAYNIRKFVSQLKE